MGVGKVEFPIREDAHISVSARTANTQQSIPSGRDIIQGVSVGFEVVNLMPLGEVQQFDAVAILANSPSFFGICEIVFQVGFSFCVGWFLFSFCCAFVSFLLLAESQPAHKFRALILC